jgi:hypothetical protein
MVVFFNKLILDFKFINSFFISFINSFFIFSSNILNGSTKKDYDFYLDNYSDYKFSFNLYEYIFKKDIFFDIVWLGLISLFYKNKFNLNKMFRSNFRILNTKNNFYFNFKTFKSNKNYLNFLKNFNLSGYFYIWNSLKLWLVPLILLFSIIYMFLFLKSLPFNKLIFAWIAILMFTYWLLSGFVFFFKKYQFSKYTTAVQRFWRRTYILFWLIEGSTFLVFLFFTMNASQESFYMFDQISIFKSHLYSWKLFFMKIFPIVLLILFSYFLILSLKWNLFSKHSIWLFFITFFLTYTVWLEFYQFFHVLNFYGNLNWVYDLDDHSWSLELESRKSRMVNHYVMVLFILKFWHIIFIYGFWLFFVLRSLETNRIRYPLLSANFQNFIILYIFAWVFMYPWFKFFFRRFLDSPYYWFYINNRKLFFRVFFYDFKLIYYGLISNLNFHNTSLFKFYDFYYFKFSSNVNNYDFFKKNYIKNNIILSLNK